MSQVAINKCKNPETTSQTFLEQLSYWNSSKVSLTRSGTGLLAYSKTATAGWGRMDIQVTAMRDALGIQADASHAHEGKSGNARLLQVA